MRNANSASHPARHWIGVAETLRTELRGGAFPPGSRLPSGRALAVRFGVSEWPVQRALASLVAEGLLERRPGFGTVALTAPDAATRPIAIAFDTMGRPGPSYRWLLADAFGTALSAAGRESFLLPRDFSTSASADSLRTAVSRTNAVAVVAFCRQSNRGAPFWRTLPVPVFCVGASFDGRMVLPGFDLYEQLAAILRQTGAKRPALVSNLDPDHFRQAEEARRDGRDLLGAPYMAQAAMMFSIAMGNAHLRFPRENIIGIYQDMDQLSVRDLAARAHDATLALLRAPRPPDLLCAYPDDIAPGVVAAILESGLRVPRDLRVVLHRNAGMDPFVPFPCRWLENDIRIFAERLSHVALDMVSGRPVPTEFSGSVIWPQATLR